jgi:excisionase family DNA binding protein
MIAMSARKRPLDLDTQILTLSEVAAYLRCAPSTVYRLVKRRELAAFKAGDWRVSRAALDAWMMSKTVKHND